MFSQIFARIFADIIVLISRWIGLVVRPYATMRTIAKEGDRGQLLLLWLFSFLYFLFTNPNRIIIFLLHMGWILLVLSLMHWRLARSRLPLLPTLTLFAYSLLPTQIWFITNYMLSYLLPPPRTLSLAGQIFSVLFIGFSISLLLWKIILLYLAVRYSLRQPFYRVVYTIVLCVPGLMAMSYVAYVLGIAKVPYL